MKYTTIVLLLLGCTIPVEANWEKNEHMMYEQQVHKRIYRYENKEAICYISYGYRNSTMQCKWKKK